MNDDPLFSMEKNLKSYELQYNQYKSSVSVE